MTFGLTGWRSTSGCLVIGLWLSLAPLCSGQAQIQITSPADGTVVHPGQTLVVNVTTSTAFSAVAVAGQQPIGYSQTLSSPPYQFSVRIPQNAKPGRYLLTAFGSTPAGSLVTSSKFEIDVEATETPVTISSEFDRLTMPVGQVLPLHITATYVGKPSKRDITASTSTTYKSNNPKVATVSAFGAVTAVAPGATSIVVNGSLKIPVTVPVNLNAET